MGSLFGQSVLQTRSVKMPKNMIYLTFLAIAIRLAIAPIFYDTLLLRGWMETADASLRGNPYSYFYYGEYRFGGIGGIPKWAYPPLCIPFLYPGYAIYSIPNSPVWLFLYVFKAPFMVSDFLGAYAMYRIMLATGKTEKQALTAWKLYIFNPLLILLTAGGGSFDTLALTAILGGVYFFMKKSYRLGGFLLGLGIAIRLYPVIFLPLFIMRIRNWKDRIIFAAVSLLPFIISSAPYFLLDYRAFIGVLAGHHEDVGHFSSMKMTVAVIKKISFYLYGTFSLKTAEVIGTVHNMATGISLLVFYAVLWRTRSKRGNGENDKNSLLWDLALCLFPLYFFYRAILPSYIIWILPYSVHPPQKYLKFIWVPSFFDILIYNGALNASGIFYYTAWFTGVYINTYEFLHLPAGTNYIFSIAQILLCTYYAHLVLKSKKSDYLQKIRKTLLRH